MLGPAIAAISLGLVGHAGIGERLGRNARFASIGNGFAAALMGACGYFFSARSVFIVTAVLLVPTLLALRQIAPREINPQQAHGGPTAPDRPAAPFRALVTATVRCSSLPAASALFHLANAAMLPLMGSALTSRSSEWATVLIAHLHRRAATRRRADRALGRPPGASPGPTPSAACSDLPRLPIRGAAVCASSPIRP